MDSSKSCFEVVYKTAGVSSRSCFEVAHKTVEVSLKFCFESADKSDQVSNIYLGQGDADLVYRV